MKSVVVDLPRGVVVDPMATPTQCTAEQLDNLECPLSSAVGVVAAYVGGELGVVPGALYNMVAPAGSPGVLAANLVGLGFVVHLDGHLRAGDYGLSAEVSGIVQEPPPYAVAATLWGDPSSPTHDTERGGCGEHVGNTGKCPTEPSGKAFLTLPSSCGEGPSVMSMSVDSWEDPGVFEHAVAGLPAVSGCGALGFEPKVVLHPERTGTSEATGAVVDVHLPQNENFGEAGDADLKDASVTFPMGMTINPSAAAGRTACSPAQIGLLAAAENPEHQKIAFESPVASGFVLSYGGESTGDLPVGSSGEAVAQALEGLPGIGAGGITEARAVTGGYEVTFATSVAGNEAARLSGHTVDYPYDVVDVQGTSGTFFLEYEGHATASMPYYAHASLVEAELEKLPGLAGHIIVSGGGENDVYSGARAPYTVAFTGEGTFGKVDVDTAGGTGSVTANEETVTEVTVEAGAFEAGDLVEGDGIPQGTKIVSVSGSTLTISQRASVTAAHERITAHPPADGVSAQAGGNEALATGVEGGGEKFAEKVFNPGTGQTEATACPNASKIGAVKVTTPLLDHPLPGAVYLAEQEHNPFPGALFAVYLVVDDPASGVIVKLAGHVEPNETNGQVTTTFKENPELPVENVEVSLFGGPHAPLTTPSACGPATTNAVLTPWSAPEGAEVPVESTFNFATGCGTPGFSPSFTAGNTTSAQAGGSSSFAVDLARGDHERLFHAVSVTLPPGLLAKLNGVPRCGEAEANAGSCSQASQIGEASAAAGVGGPYWVTGGRIYLTGPYGSDPFGLSIVVPVVAGPFNLGTKIIRAGIQINPVTAQATVTTNQSGEYAIPSIVKGIPAYIREIRATINRAGFIVNPTNCSQLKTTGNIGTIATTTETSEATSEVSSAYEASNCATLKYTPTLAYSIKGRASKAYGESMNVSFNANGGPGTGQANTRLIKVTLPKQLPSRLTTIQRACVASVFEANPAACPAESDIGTWTVTTPLLAAPFTGPSYLVSHGGAAFPDLELVLQSEGVKILIDGKINIKGGITTITMETLPDAPVSSVQASFPAGPFSALATDIPESLHYDMCGQSLAIPTALVAQDNAYIETSIKVAITGCPRKLAKTPLEQALERCHKRRNKHKRAVCEKQARKKYGHNKAPKRKHA
jgi:hypothetical protein